MYYVAIVYYITMYVIKVHSIFGIYSLLNVEFNRIAINLYWHRVEVNSRDGKRAGEGRANDVEKVPTYYVHISSTPQSDMAQRFAEEFVKFNRFHCLCNYLIVMTCQCSKIPLK